MYPNAPSMEYLPTLPQKHIWCICISCKKCSITEPTLWCKTPQLHPWKVGVLPAWMKYTHAPFWWTLTCCVLPAKCWKRNTGVLSVKALLLLLLLLLLLFLRSPTILGRSSGIRTCLVGDFSPPMFKKKPHNRNYEIPRYGVTKSSKKLWNHQVL